MCWDYHVLALQRQYAPDAETHVWSLDRQAHFLSTSSTASKTSLYTVARICTHLPKLVWRAARCQFHARLDSGCSMLSDLAATLRSSVTGQLLPNALQHLLAACPLPGPLGTAFEKTPLLK